MNNGPRPEKMHPPRVDLPDTDALAFARCWRAWREHLAGNLVKLSYYAAEQPLGALGIGLPRNIARHTANRVDWPRVAVDYLARRSVYDGVVWPDGDGGGVSDYAPEIGRAYREAVRSELVCSPALLTVSAGETGDSAVLVKAYSATESGVVWDWRRSDIAAAMTVTDTDDEGAPLEIVLWTSASVTTIRRDGAEWSAERVEHPHGRPLVVALAYRPDLWAPLGHSRISRVVRDLTDEARKIKVYTAIASELYSVPQRYILGADEGLFENQTKWDAYLGNIFALTNNEDGDKPTYGQLSQMTMEPLLAVWRKNAKEFAAATSVPLHSLGVTSDSNPTSYEAMHMAENDIVIEAEALNAENGAQMETLALLVRALGENIPYADALAQYGRPAALFEHPQRPSMAQRSDFAIKVASVAGWYPSTDKFLEDLGYSEADRVRLEHDRDRVEGNEVVKSMLEVPEAVEEQASEGAA